MLQYLKTDFKGINLSGIKGISMGANLGYVNYFVWKK